MSRKLQHEMRLPAESRGSEPVAVTRPGKGERAASDGAGEEQRERLDVREDFRNDAGLIFAVLRTPRRPVLIPAGGSKRSTQVLAGRTGRTVSPTSA